MHICFLLHWVTITCVYNNCTVRYTIDSNATSVHIGSTEPMNPGEDTPDIGMHIFVIAPLYV